jgi:hypothetical protein
VKDIIQLGIDVVIDAVAIGFTVSGLPGVGNSISNTAKNAKQWTQFAIVKAQQIAGMTMKWKGKGEALQAAIDRAKAKPGDDSHSSSYGSMPALELHMTKATGLCGNAFSIPEDDSGSQITAAINFLEDYLEETQRSLEGQFRSLIIYRNDGSFGPLLDALMSVQYMRPGDNSENVYSESKRYW